MDSSAHGPASHACGQPGISETSSWATTTSPRDRTAPLSQNSPTATMLFSPFGLLAAASGLLSLTSAHNIQMKAHQRECFHEQLHKDDKMTVTFQVGDREFGGSGNLDIDFWVCKNGRRQERRNG